MKCFLLIAISLQLGLALADIPTVNKLEMGKYIGRWYEMYNSLLMRSTIQRNLYCTTEDYKNDPKEPGKITVKFTGRVGSTTGKINIIDGKAGVVDKNKPGEFSVNFTAAPRFLDTSSANYLVVKLGPIENGEYQYTVVTSYRRLFVWILARDVKKFRAEHEKDVLKWCEENGFDWFWNRPRKAYQEKDCIYSPF